MDDSELLEDVPNDVRSDELSDVEATDAPVSDVRDIRRSAMDLLARREHSRVELARKLHRRYSDYEVIEEALDKLVSDNLLSDERFTEVYVTYRKRAGFGPVRIAGELRERGINDNLASRYLNGADASWCDAALAARDKKFGSQPVATLDEKARQQKFLNYRGFRHNHFEHILS